MGIGTHLCLDCHSPSPLLKTINTITSSVIVVASCFSVDAISLWVMLIHNLTLSPSWPWTFEQVNPRWHTPSVAQLKKFASSTGPLAFIYLCKNVCYMSLQRAATVLPVLQLAAHQPAFMLWNLCAFSVTPVEQVLSQCTPCPSLASSERKLNDVLPSPCHARISQGPFS